MGAVTPPPPQKKNAKKKRDRERKKEENNHFQSKITYKFVLYEENTGHMHQIAPLTFNIKMGKSSQCGRGDTPLPSPPPSLATLPRTLFLPPPPPKIKSWLRHWAGIYVRGLCGTRGRLSCTYIPQQSRILRNYAVSHKNWTNAMDKNYMDNRRRGPRDAMFTARGQTDGDRLWRRKRKDADGGSPSESRMKCQPDC